MLNTLYKGGEVISYSLPSPLYIEGVDIDGGQEKDTRNSFFFI